MRSSPTKDPAKTSAKPSAKASAKTPMPIQGCSSLKLRQLSRRASQHFDAFVSHAGLKTTQYSLLSHVVRLGPLRPGQLASVMEMDASTLTRNLQPLVAQGLVQVGPGETGRSRQVAATKAGVLKQTQAKKEWKQAQLAFNARLGDELVARLHSVLDECLAVVHESSEASNEPDAAA